MRPGGGDLICQVGHRSIEGGASIVAERDIKSIPEE